jgi:predicted nucleotide-binding protein
MSQDPYDSPSHHDLLDGSRLFLLDLQAAALAALELLRKADSPGAATQKMDDAWLQGFGDNLARVQSWIIEHGDPFSNSGVEEVQLLFRLNILHSQVDEVIAGSDWLVLCKYLERSANILHLLETQPGIDPGVVNIGFLLGTLRDALEGFPQSIGEGEPKPSEASTSQTPKQKIDIFVAAGKAGEDVAEQLAVKLAVREVGSRAIKVVQSRARLPDLSTHALPDMVSAISSCQYGALVLLPEETTVGDVKMETDSSSVQHLRLPADLEFLLGLMVGILDIKNTFLVVAEAKEAELSELLVGLTRATYDSNDLDEDAMDNVASTIRQAISKLEKRGQR